MALNPLVQKLLQVDIDVGKHAWAEFLFNVDQLRCLLPVAIAQVASGILQAGVRWDGSGWSSTSARENCTPSAESPW